MSCSNCYNGCTEIVSDKCVRYTGIDVPVLGIQTGDSLSYVEQALIEFLTSTLDGTGIKLTIDPAIICTLVNQYLPDCEDLNALNLFKALIQASCDLQDQIDVIVAELAALEGNYDVDCLTGVSASSGTHDILQAVITKLCDVDAALVALAVDVDTNYVKLADLDALIQAYLNSIAPIAQQYVKMVPFTAVEYYGTLSNFDGSGAGIAGLGWDKIYICNGSNGTPDKRGRVGVGVTTGVPGGAMSAAVDPAVPGNPTYTLNSVNGTNTVTLSTNQMPVHTHTTTVSFTDPGHTHTYLNTSGTFYQRGTTGSEFFQAGVSTNTSSSTTGISVGVTNANAGGGLSHPNYQPALATNYIIYIP
jgi:microcystin-dependent protein